MDTIKDIEYLRGSYPILARYSSWCRYCEQRIIEGKSIIQRRHGVWMHRKCAQQLNRECCAVAPAAP
jgi:hypothetical protein